MHTFIIHFLNCLNSKKSPNKNENVQNKNQGENNCPICYRCMNINNIATLHCGHEFHKQCIEKWYHFSNCDDTAKCPFCRELFTILK